MAILNLAREQKTLSDKIAILLHVFHANREDRSAATKSIIRLENTMSKYDQSNYALMKYMNCDPKMVPVHSNNQLNFSRTLSELPNGIITKELWFAVKKDINKVIVGGNGTILLLENIIAKNDKIRVELNNILTIFQKKYEKENNLLHFIQFSIFSLGIIVSIPIFFIVIFMVSKKKTTKLSQKNYFRKHGKAKHSTFSPMDKNDQITESVHTQTSINYLEDQNFIPDSTKYSLPEPNNSSKNQLIYNMLSAVTKLKQSSNQVELIQKIVDDMVVQLNLISLNTAVELENLGYSRTELNIIANEIRNLSEKSVDDAKTVLEIINDNINTTESVLHIAESIADSKDYELK